MPSVMRLLKLRATWQASAPCFSGPRFVTSARACQLDRRRHIPKTGDNGCSFNVEKANPQPHDSKQVVPRNHRARGHRRFHHSLLQPSQGRLRSITYHQSPPQRRLHRRDGRGRRCFVYLVWFSVWGFSIWGGNVCLFLPLNPTPSAFQGCTPTTKRIKCLKDEALEKQGTCPWSSELGLVPCGTLKAVDSTRLVVNFRAKRYLLYRYTYISTGTVPELYRQTGIDAAPPHVAPACTQPPPRPWSKPSHARLLRHESL